MFTKKGARKALLEIFDTLGVIGKVLFILAFPVIVLGIIVMIPWFIVLGIFIVTNIIPFIVYAVVAVIAVLTIVAICGKDDVEKE